MVSYPGASAHPMPHKRRASSVKTFSHRKCRRAGVSSTGLFDLYCVRGALDSLGMALVAYDHQWTIGERIIFDDAQEILEREISISSAEIQEEKET